MLANSDETDNEKERRAVKAGRRRRRVYCVRACVDVSAMGAGEKINAVSLE